MKRKKRKNNDILTSAFSEVKEEINHYLASGNKSTSSAVHRKAVAKREFLTCLNELASDWFDKELKRLKKNHTN